MVLKRKADQISEDIVNFDHNILKLVLEYCSFEDLLRSRCVCKKWKEISDPLLMQKSQDYFTMRLKGMQFKFHTKEKKMSYITRLEFRCTPAAYIRQLPDKTIEVFFSPEDKVMIPPTVKRLQEAFNDPSVKLWMSDGRPGGYSSQDTNPIVAHSFISGRYLEYKGKKYFLCWYPHDASELKDHFKKEVPHVVRRTVSMGPRDSGGSGSGEATYRVRTLEVHEEEEPEEKPVKRKKTEVKKKEVVKHQMKVQIEYVSHHSGWPVPENEQQLEILEVLFDEGKIVGLKLEKRGSHCWLDKMRVGKTLDFERK